MSSPKVTHFPYLDASDHVVYLLSFWYSVFIQSDLPCWLSGKESTCNAGDPGVVPGQEDPPGEGNGCPL